MRNEMLWFALKGTHSIIWWEPLNVNIKTPQGTFNLKPGFYTDAEKRTKNPKLCLEAGS